MTTKRRNVALVIEGMGSSAASSAGIAWHYGKASIGTPGNYEWKGGTGSREGLIRPPDSVGCSVDRFECQLQGNAHTFELHASGLAKALFLGRPTRPRDVLSTALSDSDTTVAFNGDFYAWSSADDGTVVWIGDEAIKLGTYGAGPQFTSCTRGFWSTTACGQPAGMNVYAQNPKIINRRAQLMVYDRDAGTTTQAWQGFVQSLAIDNGVISVSCQDVWSRIVGAKVNRKAIDHSSSLGRGVSSGGQVVQDEQIIRAGGIKLPSTYTSGVHKISAPNPKWHSFQAVGALFHAYDLAGTQAFWRDRTSGASGDSAAQLGSFIDPDQVSRGGIRNAPVYELFVVDRIRDEADGNSTTATRRSSSRYFESKPYHPVAISMQLLTSTWAGFATDESIAATIGVTSTISETLLTPTQTLHNSMANETDSLMFLTGVNGVLEDLVGTVTSGDWSATKPSVSSGLIQPYGWTTGDTTRELEVTGDLIMRVKLKIGDASPAAGDQIVATNGSGTDVAARNSFWGLSFSTSQRVTYSHENGDGVNRVATFTLPSTLTLNEWLYIVVRRTDLGGSSVKVEMWAQQGIAGSFQQLTLQSVSGATNNGDDTATMAAPSGGATDVSLCVLCFDEGTNDYVGELEFVHLKTTTTDDTTESDLADLVMV